MKYLLTLLVVFCCGCEESLEEPKCVECAEYNKSTGENPPGGGTCWYKAVPEGTMMLNVTTRVGLISSWDWIDYTIDYKHGFIIVEGIPIYYGGKKWNGRHPHLNRKWAISKGGLSERERHIFKTNDIIEIKEGTWMIPFSELAE